MAKRTSKQSDSGQPSAAADAPQDPYGLAWGLRQQLQLMRASGMQLGYVDADRGELFDALRQALAGATGQGAAPAPASSVSRAGPVPSPAPGSPAPAAAKQKSYAHPVNVPSVAAKALAKLDGERPIKLKAMAEKVASCADCGLCESRTQTVFSRGNPNSPLMLIGEAPGADEDAQGLPFVGRSGKLLDDILSKGMGYDPSKVYISNVLKCRPPNNRNPEEREIEACRHYLEEQIAICDPMVILALGRFPAQWLLQSSQPIGKLRGKMWEVSGRKIVATYHPAYLLRNPSAKKEVWKDVQMIMDFFGREEPLPMRG